MHRTCLALFALAMVCLVQADAGELTLSYEQAALFPADRSLVRPEDGVMPADILTGPGDALMKLEMRD